MLRELAVTGTGCVDALEGGGAVFAREAVFKCAETEVERVVRGRVLRIAWRWPAGAELQMISIHSFGLHAALATRASSVVERMADGAAVAPRQRLGIVASDFNYTRCGGTMWILDSPEAMRHPPVGWRAAQRR